jgi:hypothetical protein
VRLGLVERVSQAGQRDWPTGCAAAWERLLRMRLDATREICATADDALAHVPGPHDRLREMRDLG